MFDDWRTIAKRTVHAQQRQYLDGMIQGLNLGCIMMEHAGTLDSARVLAERYRDELREVQQSLPEVS